MYQPLTKFRLPVEVITGVWLKKGLGAVAVSSVLDENQCSRPSQGMLPPEVKGAISV